MTSEQLCWLSRTEYREQSHSCHVP